MATRLDTPKPRKRRVKAPVVQLHLVEKPKPKVSQEALAVLRELFKAVTSGKAQHIAAVMLPVDKENASYVWNEGFRENALQGLGAIALLEHALRNAAFERMRDGD